MEYTHLGRGGLPVSRLCLETMNSGATTDEADAHQITDRALEHRALEQGLNSFDTSPSTDWLKGDEMLATGGGRASISSSRPS